jgi:hypothetical protein
MSDPVTLEETTAARTARELRELIEALDRRVPQVRRLGEVSIARAAALLRAAAAKRIDELEADAESAVVPQDSIER